MLSECGFGGREREGAKGVRTSFGTAIDAEDDGIV